MAAQALNCPNCGAAASTDATRCEHCHSRLATVACPACFGMMFLGSKFCSHCGAPAQRQEVEGETGRVCPRCRRRMRAVLIGQAQLRECSNCEGLWADVETVQRICRDREQQAAVLGLAMPLPEGEVAGMEKVRYVPCPVCSQLMHRVNFASCSSVIVDVCRQHGTWFDRDELRRIIEFIQAGGLDKARAREIARLERERQGLRAERTAAAFDQRAHSYAGYHDARECALGFALEALVGSMFD